MKAILCIGMSLGICCAIGRAELPERHDEKRAVTVVDTIEQRRVLAPVNGQRDSSPVMVSPDGKRYVVAVTQGDLGRNGTWLEIISGRVDCKEEDNAKVVSRLFTSSRGRFRPTHTAHFRLLWLADSERVAFLWSDGTATTQAAAVNVRTRQMDALTHHSTDVTQFVIGPGGELLYTALAAHSEDANVRMMREGFAVSINDGYTLLAGKLDGWMPWSTEETYAWSPAHGLAKVSVDGEYLHHGVGLVAKIAPDGRRAILDAPAEKLPSEWRQYTSEWMRRTLQDANAEVADHTDIRQLFVVDMASGDAHALWSAPFNPLTGTVDWMSDSRTLLIRSTYLPSDLADGTGLAGTAVVKVDLDTGRFRHIQDNENVGKAVESEGVRMRRIPTTLRTNVSPADKLVQTSSDRLRPKPSQKRTRIELRQALNSPPALYCIDKSDGQERLLLDLNPELRNDVRLGHVKLVHWQDRAGRTWTGRLYHPTNFTLQRSFPLVIQTHGYSPSEFSLLGDEQFTSAFAAQPLTNRGIAVLQMGDPDNDVDAALLTPQEPEVAMSGYESAVEHLASLGIVDRKRVGLVGFSRTGWHVEYALVHSRFPYAAAIVADNADMSYLQYLLNGAFRPEFERVNGGLPSGDGLKTWLARAPGFNADKIRAPLRLQVDSGGLPYVLSQWELFIQLRRLKRPVELYVVPDLEHGVHGMVIPNQQLASRSGTVDWMDFWLNGREDPDPNKEAQYVRWRQLRLLQQLNNNLPND